MNNDTLGLLFLGGGVAAVSALAWKRAPQHLAVEVQGGPLGSWFHPVPTLGDRPAVSSNGFRSHDSATGKQHLGVDLFYRRRDARDLIAVFPPNTPGGTPLFFMPDDVSAFAASEGVVAFASPTAKGHTVVIRHPNGWATYYTHLATLLVHRGMRVRAGQPLGTIGASPEDAEHLRHLHFELWNGRKRSGAIDPAPFLAAWSRMVSPWSPNSTLASSTTHRNGTLSAYRPVGDRGEPYPEWVRALKDEAGVYVIRDAETHEVLYVGSSSGRLYDTLTRHLQTWRRYKDFWRGQFAEGADPGLTYPRGDVEVAVRLTSPDDALDEEMRLIARLRPRDNQIGQPELEDAPF